MKRKLTLESALENLVYPEDVDCQYPAPIGSSNLYIASSSVAGDVLSIPNGIGSDPEFKSMIVQGGNPKSPVYYSSGTVYKFDAPDSNGLVGSMLEVTRPGPQWGTLYNGQSQLYYMSTYRSVGALTGHCWDAITVSSVNDTVTITDVSSNPYAGMFTLSVYNSLGVLLGTDACDNTGVAQVAPGVAGTISIKIDYAGLQGVSRRVCTVVCGYANSSASPKTMCVLKKLPFSNFKYISDRSDRLRMNSTGLLMTSVIPELYEGGSIQAGKIISSVAPESDYSSYLYTLKKKYLGKLKEGCYGMWFPSGKEWLLDIEHVDMINIVQNDSVFNMFLIDYISPGGGNISSLDIQVKVDGWIDYTTNDTTIPQIPGVVFPDEWLTAVSALEALFIFTDNPNHNKIKEVIKKASDFVRSGHPVAQALRLAGSTAVKALPPLLMAAGLL